MEADASSKNAVGEKDYMTDREKSNMKRVIYSRKNNVITHRGNIFNQGYCYKVIKTLACNC